MKEFNLGSRIKLTGAITLLACLFLLAGAANATVIYDNLDSFNSGVDSVSGWGPPLFNSFSAGQNTTLLEVQLLLRTNEEYSEGSISVALYSDSETSPGDPLLTIGTRIDNTLPLTLDVVDFPLATPYSLTADTRYWLVVNSPDSSAARWGWSADQDALGVSGEYVGYKDNVFPNDFIGDNGIHYGPYQMRLVVPLPGAVWLLGTGLAGLGLVRLRRRFKA
jgi:hypothetical protein